MTKYHKIETIYKRDVDGTKKLIEGKFRNPTVEFLKDNEWEFTEKIDGTNIRVHWDGHKVSFYGRNENSNIPFNLMNYLMDTFWGGEIEEIFEQIFGENEATLFGEGYGSGIQKGGDYRSDVSFILFDVMMYDRYMPREFVEKTAKALGIDVVPIVLTGTIQDGVDFVKSHPQSTIGVAMMEGLVGRPKVELNNMWGERLIVKIKWEDFKHLV